ncbi:MAG: hypothetical protein ACQEQ4_02185 [Fibrobacterota bacterium]
MKKRGIPISPQANKVRLIFLVLVTPFITWYAHQQYTNPGRKHPEYRLIKTKDNTLLHLYRASSFENSDHLYVQAALTPTQPDESFFPRIEYTSSTELYFQDHKEDSPVRISTLHTPAGLIRHHTNKLIVETANETVLLLYSPSRAHEKFFSQTPPDILVLIAPDSLETVYNLRTELRPRLTVVTDFIPRNDTTSFPENLAFIHTPGVYYFRTIARKGLEIYSAE